MAGVLRVREFSFKLLSAFRTCLLLLFALGFVGLRSGYRMSYYSKGASTVCVGEQTGCIYTGVQCAAGISGKRLCFPGFLCATSNYMPYLRNDSIELRLGESSLPSSKAK